MHKADITLHSTDEGLYFTFNYIRRHLRFCYFLVCAHLNFFLKIDFKFKKKIKTFLFCLSHLQKCPTARCPCSSGKASYCRRYHLNDIKVNLFEKKKHIVLLRHFHLFFGGGVYLFIFLWSLFGRHFLCSSRVLRSFVFWPVVTTWPAQTIGNGPKSMQ